MNRCTWRSSFASGLATTSFCRGSRSRVKGARLETSPHEVDRLHLEYWRECIDETYGAHNAAPQVVMVADTVARAIKWTDPKTSAVAWNGASMRKGPRVTIKPNVEPSGGATGRPRNCYSTRSYLRGRNQS